MVVSLLLITYACIAKECTCHELIVLQVQYCESAPFLLGGW